MAAAAADHADVVEAGRAVVQLHARLQAFDGFVGHLAMYAAKIFTLQAALRVHQRIGELPVGGEQQQARGVDVQATHRDPARILEARQLFENGGTAVGIFARGHHALGLVVDDDFGIVARVGGHHELLAVDDHPVAGVDRRTDAGGGAVDLDLAGLDALFEHPARAQARIGQHFVQAFFQSSHFGLDITFQG